jgi:tetratricopeptide (TPR) repeat protein
MNDLEYINIFFSANPTPDERQAFERRVAEDPSFAGEVAFFLQTMQVAKEQQVTERKNQFKTLYGQHPEQKKIAPVRKMLWYALAAAAMLTGIILGYTIFIKPAPANQLAKLYVKENLNELSITMGSKQDSLQTGLDLYNQGKLTEAAQLFGGLLKTDSGNVNAEKYAGIVYLRLQDFDKALISFRKLSTIPNLYANPGMFYQAVTLMERNGPGDVETAKQLLQQVIAQNLEGSDKAKEWLKKM